MTLKLITRKHNKPQARTLHVPVDAALAKQMRAEQAAKELERQVLFDSIIMSECFLCLYYILRLSGNQKLCHAWRRARGN
jgi:hypothetical protein